MDIETEDFDMSMLLEICDRHNALESQMATLFREKISGYEYENIKAKYKHVCLSRPMDLFSNKCAFLDELNEENYRSISNNPNKTKQQIIKLTIFGLFVKKNTYGLSLPCVQCLVEKICSTIMKLYDDNQKEYFQKTKELAELHKKLAIEMEAIVIKKIDF